MSTAFGIVLTAVGAALGTPPPEPFYVDVRTYLPEGYVTDGSVDYKAHIQRCFDENLCVAFPGSDDPDRPMVYGITAASVEKILEARSNSRIRFGPNAVLKRLPSFGELLRLGDGTHLTGAVIDGNKYAHWPLVKDRKVEYYAFSVGAAIVVRRRNVIRDCFVYNNAGHAFIGWHASDNKIYRTRAENCGFLEAMDARRWRGEHASGDGFHFSLSSAYNVVKDSEAIDCSRWGFVITEGVRHSMFVDCRGGNVHLRSFGFLDVVEGPGTILVRCRSPNSYLEANSDFQEMIGCSGTAMNAKHASYPRQLGNTIIGDALMISEVDDDRLITPGELSPMLGFNRVFLSGPSDMSLSVVCEDGLGTAAFNVLYGYEDDAHRSTEMLLFGVGARQGNLQAWGQWQEPLGEYAKPHYLRAHMDFDFKKRFRGPSHKPPR